MRHVIIGLVISGLVLGGSSGAWAKWVWRDGRWVYVDETPAPPDSAKTVPGKPAPAPAPKAEPTPPQPRPPAPAPKVEPPAPKVESPAPKVEPPAPKVEPPAPRSEESPAPAPKLVPVAPKMEPPPPTTEPPPATTEPPWPVAVPKLSPALPQAKPPPPGSASAAPGEPVPLEFRESAPLPKPALPPPREGPRPEPEPPRPPSKSGTSVVTPPAPAQGGSKSWWRWSWGTSDDKTLFEQGRSELASRQYRAAARTLKTLIKDHPASPNREEAMWLRAAALWGIEDYYGAFDQYEELVTNYAGSPHYKEALEKEIEIAEIYLGPTRRKVLGIPLTSGDTEAIEILRKVYEHQPTGDLADDIILRIADYHWSKANWADAEDYYDKYCREFPNGPAAHHAELARAKCAIERCRGSRYDTSSLQLAYDRLRAFQQKFPEEAAKEGVGPMLLEVREMQAEGLYETAAHYLRTGRAEAAAFYAERLVERYPDTTWSEKARKFLANASLPAAARRGDPGKEEPKP